MKWTIGDTTVTMVRESVIEMTLDQMYPDSDPSVVDANRSWLGRFLGADDALSLACQGFVVESMGHVIVVDTCTGTREVPAYPDLSNVPSPFFDNFLEAGFDPDRVDFVACTHLHIDHVGWNTKLVDGKWVPTFPNASYLFSKIDYEHWDSGAEGAAWTFDGACRPVYEAGLVDLVEMDHTINAEVRLEPTPGHSPGHVSVHITSGDEEAVITGDVVHHPVQFAAPHWRMFLDGDPETAGATRTAFVDRYANTPVRLFGPHFADDSTGFLTRSGDTVSFVSG